MANIHLGELLPDGLQRFRPHSTNELNKGKRA
jgi:hypothetical protein